jgi:hypothetical protein
MIHGEACPLRTRRRAGPPAAVLWCRRPRAIGRQRTARASQRTDLPVSASPPSTVNGLSAMEFPDVSDSRAQQWNRERHRVSARRFLDYHCVYKH